MRKISLIFQEFLKILLIFLLFFVWLRYFVRKFFLASFISLLLTAFVYLLMIFISHKKKNKAGLKLKEKEEAENMFLSQCISQNMTFYEQLAQKKHKNITKHKAYITINHEESGTKTVLYPYLSFQSFDTAKFVEIYNKIKKEKMTKIVILCGHISDKNLFLFIKSFKEKILILDQYESYQKLYKLYDCFPPIIQTYAKESKLCFKDFLGFSFNKKRAKGYLFSALVLVLSSVFMRSNIYYCFIASILVVFAILSYFNLFQHVQENEIF